MDGGMSTLKVDRLESNTSGSITFASPINPNGFSSNYRPGEIIETLSALCDGQSYTVSSGTYTTQNVSSSQTYTDSYVDLNGSTLNYTAPTGTAIVIYEFFWLQAHTSANNIAHYRFYIDDVEVTDARLTESGGYEGTQVHFQWTIPIGGVTDAATGRQATWTTAKELRMEYRDYGSSNYGKLHETTWWDGVGGNQFHRPQIKITAIA